MFKTLQNKISQIPLELKYRAELAKHTKALPQLSRNDQPIVDALQTEGVYVTSLEKLGFSATPALLNAVSDLLPESALALGPKVGDQGSLKPALQLRPAQFVTLTDYPEFFLWGLESRLLNMMEAYIGLPVAYHGVNLRYDVGVDKPGSTQQWHRDGEDRRIGKLIVYLSDVGPDNGPFEYIPKSSTPSYQSFGHIYRKILASGYSGISDEEMARAVPPSAWKSCLGPAGTVVFVDTRSVFHRGKPPRAERSALFYVYTSRQPIRPDICKANFKFDAAQLASLMQTLPQHQRDCVL
jgi:hypothetical protein